MVFLQKRRILSLKMITLPRVLPRKTKKLAMRRTVFLRKLMMLLLRLMPMTKKRKTLTPRRRNCLLKHMMLPLKVIPLMRR
ncbi:unnamed protein product [Dibothriocephalus latus]|uniref:Uncharacterized protein n=1 Tax=Dibothriocephalus latus TaxID=60516 RepID=A0A3P7M9V8_DIBLA|nr:unnamed protein product [Dibothriocephalus latus]